MHFEGPRIPKDWLKIGDIYLFLPAKIGIMDRLRQIVEKGKFWAGCRENRRRE